MLQPVQPSFAPASRPILALLAVLAIAATPGAFPQRGDTRLSVLSSWRVGHRLHVGVTTPAKQFDQCLLYVGEVARPLASPILPFGLRTSLTTQRVDPIPLAPQYGAEPTSGPGFQTKWSLQQEVPDAAGLTLRFQALLLSSSTGEARLTNAFQREIEPAGPSEYRWAVESKWWRDEVWFGRMDVDAFVPSGPGPVTHFVVPDYYQDTSSTSYEFGGFHGPAEVAPDGRHAVLLWQVDPPRRGAGGGTRALDHSA